MPQRAPSNANLSTAMLALIDSQRFLISTNGDNFGHPEDAAIAKVIATSGGRAHSSATTERLVPHRGRSTVPASAPASSSRRPTSTYSRRGVKPVAVVMCGSGTDRDQAPNTVAVHGARCSTSSNRRSRVSASGAPTSTKPSPGSPTAESVATVSADHSGYGPRWEKRSEPISRTHVRATDMQYRIHRRIQSDASQFV